MSYKAICRWLLHVLGLEVPRQSQTVIKIWLLLVPGLGLLSQKYRVWWLARMVVACFRGFRKM